MSQGRRSRWGLLTAAAAVLLAAVAPASAGDGDNCCADLETRVAELEALTTRKGNRALSLQISGTINQAELAWYDGKASNVYTVTNDNYRSRFGFAGKPRCLTVPAILHKKVV